MLLAPCLVFRRSFRLFPVTSWCGMMQCLVIYNLYSNNSGSPDLPDLLIVWIVEIARLPCVAFSRQPPNTLYCRLTVVSAIG